MAPPIDFQALFDLSPNPYMVLDRELRYVAANRAYLRVTASRLEDLLGREVFEAFPNDAENPNDVSVRLLRQSFERVLATGVADVVAVIPYKVPLERDGATVHADRYWSATHTPIADAHGRVTHILQHTVDVTELHERRRDAGQGTLEAGVLGRARQLQEANFTLDVERRHLRGIFEQAPGFMCFLRGREFVFEFANAAYMQLVGHRDILGRPIREALPELESQGFFSLLDRVADTGEPFVGSGARVLLQRHPGAEPDEAFVDFSYQPITDATGEFVGILTQGYDITRQTRQDTERLALLERERTARAAAEEAEVRQRFFAEAIPQQVWTARPDGNLDFVNRRVLEYFGATEDEVLGGGWQAVVHPDDLSFCVDRWGSSLRTGEEYEAEFRLRRADGAYRWHLARALALHDADGRIAKWFGTNTDMDELTRARDELRGRAEFDQQLIGIVSHDLRNPLNAIGMATALLLQRGRLDEQHVKIVTRIMSSSERAVRLIRDFLDFTHARVSGRIPVTPVPASLRDIARQVFEEVHLMYPDRKASCEHHGEDSGTWDADRVAQVIGNLTSNAFQHSGSTDSVRLVTAVEGETASITVSNGGPAIDPRDLPRLFEPFQRGTQASVHSGRSIGLGLYISKQIVSAHGGTIDVQSSPGQGTRFLVTLPRHAGDIVAS